MALLADPVAIVAVLVTVEGVVLYLSDRPLLRRLFSVLPPLFWIYFLPTVASATHLIPSSSPLYGAVVDTCLPACLVLLFLAVDLRAILRLGGRALLMMAASSAGIVLGGPLVMVLFGRWLPAHAWSGLGALSGSWLGGSANMVAVKASIGTPDSLFALMVIVDVVVAYSWMGLLIALAGLQRRYDRWNRSETSVMEQLSRRLAAALDSATRRRTGLQHLLAMLTLAAGGAAVSLLLARALPQVEGVISSYTWTIVLVSAIGILLSFTPARRLEASGASELGYALLYLVLTCIGARADLSAVTRVPALLLAGSCWIAFHGLLLLGASRLTRTPIFLAATASQANIGGPVSAPIVAAAYQPALSQVGLLLAVLGNIVGTYLGILCAMLCRAVAG
jgi:uncharacterized membrane protein